MFWLPFLLLLWLIGGAHAQELFPLQQLPPPPPPQFTHDVIGVAATPAAFLSSSGTVNAQLSTQCLGGCAGAPTYVLASNPSGFCSGNNNNSFSLTPAGNLTAGGLPSTVYACVKVTMPGASNTGQIWLLQMTSVASPTINAVTLRQPYFSAGSAFSSPIDIACQDPSVLGSTSDLSKCTSVPSITLDNTPGDCPQPNDPLFSVSGDILAISTPQTTAKDYYSCVQVAMAGAAAAPFQLKATISSGETVTPVISGTYFNPPFYATNSPYQGTLVTYCVNSSINSSVGAFATHCPSTPSYTFSASCGGNNNNNFTLSGPNNQIITSNGSLSTGNLFPCVIPTVAGAGGSGNARYVNLYANGQSSLVGIAIEPAFFSTAVGTMTGTLRPKCANAECTGAPQYAFSTACPSNDNGVFTLNGSALTANTTTPSTYTACLAMSMTGAGNTGAPFQVPVTVTTSTGNCPTTPPPQAAAAGFTQLTCFDFSQPQYANVFNWANCTHGVVASNPNQFWNLNGVGGDCGVSEGVPEVSQVVDPATGRTVLKFHWDGTEDTDLLLGNFLTLFEYGKDFPTALLAEIRMRMSPDHVASYSSQCCGPDFWSFSTQSTYLPPGCVQSDPTNFCYNAIPEVDGMESGNGIGLLDAVHQYGLPALTTGGATCCVSGQGYFSSGDGPTLEMWNANNLAGVPFQGYTTFGTRYLTDGVSATQYCYYWDNVLVQSFTGSGTPRFAPACQSIDFTAAGPNALAWALRGRHQFNAWIAGGWSNDSYVCQKYSGTCTGNGQQGPENQDTYLEYIAIWEPPNADQYNLGNGFDSQPPAPVPQPWPY